MPRAPGGGGGGDGGGTAGTTSSVTKAAAAVAFAQSYIGTPYKWGGSTPHKGMDCSGLCSVAYFHAGLYIPRTTFTEYAFPGLHPVSRSNLQPGDLLFYYRNEGGRGPGHVVMYVGGGQIIQAAHTGTKVAQSAVWWSGFVGARRHVQANQTFNGDLPRGAHTTAVADAMGFPGSGIVGDATGVTAFLGDLPRYLEMAAGGAVLLLGAGIGIYGSSGGQPVKDTKRVAGAVAGAKAGKAAGSATSKATTPARDPAEKADAIERRAKARADAATSRATRANERTAGADARLEAKGDRQTRQQARGRVREIRTRNTEDYREGKAAKAAADRAELRDLQRVKLERLKSRR